MSVEAIKALIPDTAKDIRLNFTSLLSQIAIVGLSKQQGYATLLALAYATKQSAIIEAVTGLSEEQGLSVEASKAAQSAAAIMAMNNVYYRTVFAEGAETLRKLPAGLRMQVIGKPGIEKVDFEFMCLAVSALNGCNHCVQAHMAELEKADMKHNQLQWAVKAAAIVNGINACSFL